jgi:hypothetical protein
VVRSGRPRHRPHRGRRVLFGSGRLARRTVRPRRQRWNRRADRCQKRYGDAAPRTRAPRRPSGILRARRIAVYGRSCRSAGPTSVSVPSRRRRRSKRNRPADSRTGLSKRLVEQRTVHCWQRHSRGYGYDLFTTRVGSRIATYPVASPFDEVDADLSPDMRWIAYAATDESGRWEVYVRPLGKAAAPCGASRDRVVGILGGVAMGESSFTRRPRAR